MADEVSGHISSVEMGVVDPEQRATQQADEVARYWDSITHLSERQGDESKQGNRRVLPRHYLQLGDRFHNVADNLSQQQDLFSRWTRGGIEARRFASSIVNAQAAYQATEAFHAVQVQMNRPNWRDEVIQHSEDDMTADSPARLQTVRTPTEDVYMYVVTCAVREAANLYEKRSYGEEVGADIAQVIYDNVAARLGYIYGISAGELPGIPSETVRHAVEEFVQNENHEPTPQDMVGLLRQLDTATNNRKSAQEFVARADGQRIAKRQTESERAREQLAEVPSLAGFTDDEKNAIAEYFRSIADQDPFALPPRSSVDEVLENNEVKKATDREVALAKALGYYVDGENEPLYKDPAIRRAKQLLMRAKLQMSGNTAQTQAYVEKE